MGTRLEGSHVLITGGSDGIGRAIAEQLDRRAGRLTLVARGESGLREVADRLSVETRIIPCDLARPGGPEELLEQLAHESIDVLVNNAGSVVGGAFAGQDIDAVTTMLRLNIDAPLRLTRGLLPAWVERGHGAILNVGSMAGFVGCPGQSVYGGTKSFLNYFSEGLRGELHGSGVQVTVLAPGSTRTGFFARGGIDPTRLMKRFQDADAVARAGLRALERGERLRIPGWSNRAMYFGLKMVPRGIVGAAARRVFRELVSGAALAPNDRDASGSPQRSD